MLGGISLKSKRRKEIELWIAQIQESITSIPESDMHPVGYFFQTQIVNQRKF